MAFKLKSGNTTSFKQMGSSPAKDMKTGSYEHSFESPAKQKGDDGKKNFDNALIEAQAKKESELTDMDKEVLRRAAQHNKEKVDLTNKAKDKALNELLNKGFTPMTRKKSPAKQKYDLSDMTIVDKRPQEVIDKEKEEIKKEERLREKIKKE